MKRTIRIATISSAAAFAACFGAGPIPSSPEDATIIFGVPAPTTDSTCHAYFIGDVAVGSAGGYAAVVPYAPQSCGGGGSIAPNGESIGLYGFHPDGGSASNLGQIPPMGMGFGFVPLPRVAVGASGPIWAYASLGMPQGIYVGSGGSGDELVTSSTTDNFVPAGLAVGSNGTVYIAQISQNSFRALDDPSYPCCGMAGTGDGSGLINTYHPNGTGTAVRLACSTTDRCLAATDNALYFFENSATGGAFTVNAMAKATQAITKVADGPGNGPASAPAGIAISGDRLVWTSAPDVLLHGTASGCVIGSWNLTAMTPGPTWMATQISCMDVAVDGDDVYFAIVHPDGTDPMSDENLHGDGIGHVNLATMDFTSVNTGIEARGFGPRRVLLDATYVYAIDPQAIARIPRAAIDGHHDFTP